MAAKSKRKKRAASAAKKGSLPIVAFMAACDLSSRDPNSGKLTLYGLFDAIQFDSLPAIFGPFTLYAKVSGGAGRATATFVLLDPNGNPVSQDSPQFRVDFEHVGGRIELVLVMPPIEFKKTGVHRLYLKCGEALIEHPLELSVIKAKKTNRS